MIALRNVSVVFCLLVTSVAGPLVAHRPAAAAEIPWAVEGVVTDALDGIYDATSADVDNDGDLDLVAAGSNAGWVTWWRNLDGVGGTWQRAFINSGLPGADSVAVADIDRDGDVDVLSVSYDDGKVVWCENEGFPFDTWLTHIVDASYPGAIVSRPADLNGDGNIDIVGASLTTDTISWWENDGSSSHGWTRHTISPGNIDGPRSVEVADIDQDGDLDVVAAGTTDNIVIWYENANGLGTSWIERPVDTAVHGADAVVVADIDGDGDPDIIGAARTDDQVALWRNDGTPRDGGWIQLTLDFSFDYACSVAVHDLDADGDLDVAATSYYGDAVTWWENLDGEAHLWESHAVSTTFNGAWVVSAGDIDGDGDLDVFGGAYSDDTLSWWRNDTIHRSAVHPTQHVVAATLPWVEEARAADVDGDGDLDVVVATGSDNRIGWYENDDGAGGSWSPHGVSGTVPSASSADAADLDGDGDLDILGASYDDDTLIWWEQPGGSKAPPWSSHPIETSFSGAKYLRALDLDHDGDLDVLAAGRWGGVAWFENTASTGLSWTQHVVDGAVTGLMAEAADLDGDGDLDVASTDTDAIFWYENTDGVGGAWSAANTVAAYFDDTETVRAADMDRDGDLDLVGSASFIGEVRWWENDAGDGSSWSEHVVEASYTGVLEAYPVDLDGDGDLDICGATWARASVVCWVNGGDGVTWTRSVTVTETSANDVFPADLDADGDVDLISAGRMNDDLGWWENRGGQLALPTSANPGTTYLAGGGVADVLSISPTHAGRSGDAAEELVEVVLRLEDAAGVPLSSAQANALIDTLSVYCDDGSGTFDGSDALVTSLDSLVVVAGRVTLTVPPGNPDTQVAWDASRMLFIVLQLQADAETVEPNRFRVSLVAVDSSARDLAHDLPLVIQYEAPTTATISVGLPLFADGFDTGSTGAWSATVP